MDRRWLTCVGALVLLSACTGAPPPATGPAAASALGAAQPTVPAGPPRIALLLPVTGPMSAVAGPMVQAAQLALSVPGSPPLDVRDTGGDPQRAADAARAAIAGGDRLILGPLTAPETAAVGAAASTAQVPVLAFTSDPAAAAPGVWTLGLTPAQQVRRLVGAARDDGRQHLAAILPQGALGDALQTALEAAATDAGLEAPTVQRPAPGLGGFTDSLKVITQYEGRRGSISERVRKLRESSDPADREEAARLSAEPTPPPPFDALLIGEAGPSLPAIAESLPAYDVITPQVRVLGPALWAQQAGGLGKLAGAWYAALDPATRQSFVTAFQSRFGAPPSPFADYAFDGAAIAGVLAGENDFSANALTRSEGFTGVDGALNLLPDGHVRRALAVFQINQGGGASIVSQAPQELSQPGS